jgi:hypothetical protein
MSLGVLCGVGKDVVGDGEFFEGEGCSFDVASDELLALFVVERVTKPDAEARVVLRQDLRHIIVSDELSLMELCQDPFRKGLRERLREKAIRSECLQPSR